MNAAATRRMYLDMHQRQRIKRRVAEAEARARRAAEPCQCLICQIQRFVKDAGPGEVEVTVTSDTPEPPAGAVH